MRICLWCHTENVHQIHWKTLVLGSEQNLICTDCENELSYIKGNTCRKCFRQTTKSICADCKRWKLFFNGSDPLIHNVSTFQYNDFMKELIAKWKYRGDYILIDIFTEAMNRTFQKHMNTIAKESILVPIPLSEERLYERGFNQSVAIAERLTNNNNIVPILERVYSEKQSKKSRSQRIFRKNPFKLLKKTNKSVILVDDIYTTGTTLRHAAILLRKSGCPAVYSYSLIRG